MEKTAAASGVILAGGQSSRMEENKAFVRVGGTPIIEILVERLARAFADVILVTNQPELYAGLGVRVVTDLIPRLGPLSGLHAGLAHAGGRPIFACACDMPFVSMELARFLLGLLPGHDAVAPLVGGRFQPLCAAYAPGCLAVFERCLHQGRLKISRVYQEELKVRYVSDEEVARFGDPEVLFCNVNSPEALARARQLARGGAR
ncbi:MAG: molybdenum cofactor guanylyltransferase [Syntrophomonadaceae bacterium]|nr:molybdenum cofactor guanylyltransferase [Syntrophomonadaceae bacterium]